jgi:hypothetical protein
VANPNDIRLAPEQKLTEMWEIQYEGRERRGQRPYRIVTGTIKHWFHSTYYGGATGEGETVQEARLAMVLGLARAICNDESAFSYDAEQIGKSIMLHWFQDKLKELVAEFDVEDLTEKQSKKLRRRIKFLEQLTAEWQEDNDYWPEEADATETETTRQADTHTARAALVRARAEGERTGAGKD